ncbi:MAG: 30S ribosomal protein S17 [Parcubacteria group bacterium GW2011_GWA1_50_14]|uniref:Small ribosomal subunit protein uS17 n=1 Tax=Candidatus Liptonbacteria bacterium GWB1_49_6 TaxID=1798644 RepID=A0A1G2C8G6_9BACT|nr:MAG: 30S ribosomal protein S17 [Parcubacteria group bacterium GW2011_GWA1_50_14]OGY96940.1 MAG: 30S ribosomal protein S17 [Candidatus Liptonbacteria bacterium GWB1_49_6]
MNKEKKATIQRKLTGVVVSDRMDKTRVILVERFKRHPKYRKYYRVTTKFKAHDPKNEYKMNDRVVIKETRPISKEKRWIIIGTA